MNPLMHIPHGAFIEGQRAHGAIEALIVDGSGTGGFLPGVTWQVVGR